MGIWKEFDGLSSVYAIGRPAYANEFIKDLYGKFGVKSNEIFADIGSGTGKLAKQIIEKGNFVYCVEPNDDMRQQALKELSIYSNKECISGNAEATTLPDKSVNYITTAQAFHWFNVELFKKECKRIIQPNGKIFLIWNIRDINSELVQRSYNIYRKYCPKFKGFSGGIQKDDERIRVFFDNDYKRIVYDNPLYYNKDTFITRSLSGSYSLKQHDKFYGEYIEQLDILFDKYAVDNMIIMPNKTIVYAGMVK